MTITTEVTEQDYRALQWSMLVDRAKLHWGVLACLPLAALLFWFAAGAEESAALTLRVFGSILGGVGLLLLAIMVGFRLTQKAPLGDGRVPLGSHTYDVTDKAMVVTTAERGRIEVPVAEISAVNFTESHVFVVPKRGTDYIIPRRGMDSGQLEALQSLRGAVVSSQHVDHLKGAEMSPERVAKSMVAIRWTFLFLAMGLLFTFGSGPISSGALLWAIMAGVVILTGMLLSWRMRKDFWSAALFLVPVVFSHLAGVRDRPVPITHFFQWLLIALMVPGFCLLLFPRFFRRIARIETEQPSPHVPAGS